jgi:predicted TIM-barrel fold metal-dependent hydrolase
MDEAGITCGVSMGRQSAEPLGCIPNEEIRDSIAENPDRFVGFAGIDIRRSADDHRTPWQWPSHAR